MGATIESKTSAPIPMATDSVAAAPAASPPVATGFSGTQGGVQEDKSTSYVGNAEAAEAKAAEVTKTKGGLEIVSSSPDTTVAKRPDGVKVQVVANEGAAADVLDSGRLQPIIRARLTSVGGQISKNAGAFAASGTYTIRVYPDGKVSVTSKAGSLQISNPAVSRADLDAGVKRTLAAIPWPISESGYYEIVYPLNLKMQ